ncbi:MAG: TIGR01777 family oxidoreductase [archaeon]
MAKKVIITGATGLIGKYITQILSSRGDEVTIFSRSPNSARTGLPGAKEFIEWDSLDKGGEWQNHIEGKDAVIHLAGEPLIGALWSNDYKEKILKSRELGTRTLVHAISRAEDRPEAFISASAIGYYGSSENEVTYTEDSRPGDGFLADVCRRWEAEASEADTLGLRRACVRVGIVLDKREGTLEKLLTPFRYFMGGTVGEGRQWISWIHLVDVANIFIFALDNSNVSGALNAVAPEPIRMKDFMNTLGSVMNRPSWLKIPEFPIRAAIGEASVPVTEGIKALPKRTMDLGYRFQFTRFEDALNDLLKG